MAQVEDIEVVVGPDGALVVDAAVLAQLGAHPGDLLTIKPAQRSAPRSMLGFGSHVPGPPAGFTNEDLRSIRHEMGSGTGEGLTA